MRTGRRIASQLRSSRLVGFLCSSCKPVVAATCRLQVVTYYNFPKTEENADDLDAIVKSGKRVIRGQRFSLSLNEKNANSKARVSGFLRLHNGARPVLTKVYARECYSRRRPFIGLNKHAERLFVDTRPASGFHKWREDSRVDKVMEAFAKVLKNPVYKHAVVYNPDATVDRDAAAAAGKEGSNDYRPPEVKPEDEETFAVSVPSQAIGLRLAEELYGAFCELFPEEEHTVEQHETRRANRSERRRVAKEAKHRHMLRIIAQRKDLLRKVPRGSIDKFIELDRQGQFEDSPVEGDAGEEGARQ